MFEARVPWKSLCSLGSTPDSLRNALCASYFLCFNTLIASSILTTSNLTTAGFRDSKHNGSANTPSTSGSSTCRNVGCDIQILQRFLRSEPASARAAGPGPLRGLLSRYYHAAGSFVTRNFLIKLPVQPIGSSSGVQFRLPTSLSRGRPWLIQA